MENLTGVITAIQDYMQKVETDAEADHLQVMYLRGMNYITGGKVGDKVALVYSPMSRSGGLWFGHVIGKADDDGR